MCEYYNTIKNMPIENAEQQMLLLLAEQIKSTRDTTEQKITNINLQIEHLNANIKSSFESLGKELQYINNIVKDIKDKQKEDTNDIYDEIRKVEHIDCPQALDKQLSELSTKVSNIASKVEENIDFIIVIKKYKIIALLLALGVATLIYTWIINKEANKEANPIHQNIIETLK